MPLSDKQREDLEDTIMDLHFTSEKYLQSEKEIHHKLLEMNVVEALELLQDLSKDIRDDPKRYDYKIHLFLPIQIYETSVLRSKNAKE